MPRPNSPATAAAYGVRKPTTSSDPEAIPTRAANHVAREESGSRR